MQNQREEIMEGIFFVCYDAGEYPHDWHSYASISAWPKEDVEIRWRLPIDIAGRVNAFVFTNARLSGDELVVVIRELSDDQLHEFRCPRKIFGV
jgi:hypothetical protein